LVPLFGLAGFPAVLALAEELGMRPLVAHCHLGLGKLYRHAGKREQGARAPHHRDDDVPRDGHDVLAGAGRDKGVSMKQGAFLLVTSSIFAVIALLHALRLFYGWKVTLGEWTVPVWVSWIGLLIAGYLAYQGFLLKNNER
jgi:hypothetical protein